MKCTNCKAEVALVGANGVCVDCTPTEPVKTQTKKETAIAPRPPVEMTGAGVHLRSLDDLARFAQMIVQSGLAPRGMEKPEAVAVAVQAGMELGFSPMRALSAVYVVNGRPTLSGTAALAKIKSSGALKPGTDVETGIVGTGDERVGYVRTTRATGGRAIERTFTVGDAKKAGLWGKAGPWTSDPEAMLIWRAVARTAKLDWSDVLMGLEVAEVVRDYSEPPRRMIEAPAEPDPILGGAE